MELGTPLDKEPTRAQRLRALALAAAASGAGLGAINKLIFPKASGAASTGIDVLKGALTGAGAGAGLATASGYAGDKILGTPEKSESNPYSRRGAVGGAVAGGTLGGLAGTAVGSGALKGAYDILPGKARDAIKSKVLDNIPKGYAFEAMKKISERPSAKSALIAGLLGAAGMGTVAAMHGADEGMGADFIRSEVAMRKKLKRTQEKLKEAQE